MQVKTNIFEDLDLLKQKILEIRKNLYKPYPVIYLDDRLLNYLLRFLSKRSFDNEKAYDLENNYDYIRDFSNLFISTLNTDIVQNYQVDFPKVFVTMTNFFFAKKELET